MIRSQKIAVLCNYELLPNRVGGMDYFFWKFDQKCKAHHIQVDWFFPNQSSHGEYNKLNIYDCHYHIEPFFLDFCRQTKPKYDYVITHFAELCTSFFYKLKHLSKAKIIAVDHNPRPLMGYPLKKKVEKRIKGILYSRYIDVFVGVSDYTVNEIVNDFGSHLRKKAMTIYNGVVIDDILIRNHRNEVKPTFLVASHLRESKGIQDLIAAVNLLPTEIKSEINIDVFGDGPFKEQLIAKIKQYDLEEYFTFLGSKSNLNEIFCNYDYMLQPSHMECFSLSILESLAANVPAITTNVGGNEEVIHNEKNGFIFKAQDIYALKEILEDVFLGNRKIVGSTRRLIEECFSLEKMVDNHLALVLKNKL